VAADVRSGAGHGLVLVRRSPPGVTRWVQRGLVPVTVAPFGPWTGIALAEDRARSAAPYDVALEVLAARPAPWRARPAVGLFDVHGRAAITVQPAGIRSGIHWLVWEPRRGVVETPRLDRLTVPMLLRAAGTDGAVREEAVAEVLRSGLGTPVDLLVTVLGLLGLPGREMLIGGESEGAADVEPSARGVMAFDRLMAEEAAHRADLTEQGRAGLEGGGRP
jgi:hypothetical protein